MMVTTKLNLSMTEPQVRQIYAKQGDTGRVLDISLDQTPEDGTLRILRPDGVEVTSEAVTGGEVESGGTFESLTEADVTELTVGIEPVQDLNGYEKPWVGGAGKNKLNFDMATTTINGVTFTNNGDGTYTVSGTSTAVTVLERHVTLDVAQGTPLILSGCPSGGSTNTYAVDTYGTDIALTRDYGSGGTFTASGLQQLVRIVVFANVTMNNLVFKPMIRLSSVSDATFAPYSNICPITGHDEVEVTRTGKNLADISNAPNATNVVDSVDADGKIHFKDVTARWSSTYIGKMFVKAGETYTISGGIAYGRIGLSTNTSYPRIDVNIPDITVLSGGDATLTKNRTVNSFTANYTGYMYVFYCSDANYAEAHGEFSCYVFCNVGSTATAYEPYQGSTYTTSLGQTVYGGTLDMVSGVLTVTHGNIASYNGETLPSTWISDRDVYASGMTPTTGAQVVYELATPLTYTLTAHQIKTLVGTNNVWASSGQIVNITFTYGGLLSELPSDATSIVGKCYCDVEQNGVSSMPFTLNVKKNERQ